MHKISLDNFVDDIQNIREYIRHIHLVNDVENVTRKSKDATLLAFNNHLHSFAKNIKIFEYKSIVISLYGILEKHINIWIQEHVDSLSAIISKYDNLPDKLKKNHFSLSIRLISLVLENKYVKYDHLKKEDILLKLSSCVDGSCNYSLNSDSFLPLSGNLKHSKVCDAFKTLDINLQEKIKLNEQFSIFLENKYEAEVSSLDNDIFALINDLVLRRNDIAHGVNIDTILNITEFDDYIDFLECYGKAIFETIVEKETQYEATYLCRKVTNVKGVFKKGSILCFEIDNQNIKVGDVIIYRSNKKIFNKKKILGIHKNRKSFNDISISDNSLICVDLGTGAGITKNQSFFIRKTSLL